MSSELDLLKQEKVKLLVKKAELEAENAKLKAEKAEFINSIKKDYADFVAHVVKLKHLSLEQPYRLESIEAIIIEIKTQNAKNISIIEEYEKELEYKKNRKFQTRCIQIAKETLNEEPMIEYRPPFLNGLELDAFFQKYRIALEVQGSQHRFHSTSWYKDVKKLEGIVNRDRQKRCICLDNGIFLLEVWYDQNPEVVIPERIRKIKEFVDQTSKSFDLL